MFVAGVLALALTPLEDFRYAWSEDWTAASFAGGGALPAPAFWVIIEKESPRSSTG